MISCCMYEFPMHNFAGSRVRTCVRAHTCVLYALWYVWPCIVQHVLWEKGEVVPKQGRYP